MLLRFPFFFCASVPVFDCCAFHPAHFILAILQGHHPSSKPHPLDPTAAFGIQQQRGLEREPMTVLPLFGCFLKQWQPFLFFFTIPSRLPPPPALHHSACALWHRASFSLAPPLRSKCYHDPCDFLALSFPRKLRVLRQVSPGIQRRGLPSASPSQKLFV